MKKPKVLALLVTMLLVMSINSCKTPEIQKKPNVLLICIDDLRPELKSFGADYISSPNIDALAEIGGVFSTTFCKCTKLWTIALCLVNWSIWTSR